MTTSTAAPGRRSARFHVEFVTPCFLGGADGSTAEWRAASIRGQLRWWLRAIAPGDLDRVRKIEERIFGSTSQASNVVILTSESPQPSSAEIRVAPKNAEQLAETWKDSSPQTVNRLRLSKAPTSNPVTYLGFGPIVRDRITRSYLPTTATPVSFQLRWNRLTPENEQLLLAAVAAWLHLGGIGARSRRGFGSLRCTKAEAPGGDVPFIPTTRGELKKQLRSILEVGAKNGTEWSRLGASAEVYLGSQSCRKWEDALSLAGSWMIAFRRRYGAPTDTRTDKKKGPGQDYAWAAPGGTKRREGIPDRAGFGLPLPFGKDGETVVWGDPRRDHRRASPLLIHVSKLADGTYLPLFTHLPAPLAPRGEKLVFKNAGKQPAKATTATDVVKLFLDDLAAKNLVEAVG